MISFPDGYQVDFSGASVTIRKGGKNRTKTALDFFVYGTNDLQQPDEGIAAALKKVGADPADYAQAGDDVIRLGCGVREALLEMTTATRTEKNAEIALRRAEGRRRMDEAEKMDEALIDEARKGLPALLAQIPSDGIRLEAREISGGDGYKLYEFFAEGEKIDHYEAIEIGHVSATRPGAMNPFFVEHVIFIPRQRLEEMRRERIEAEEKARIEAGWKASEREEILAAVSRVDVGRVHKNSGDDFYCDVVVVTSSGETIRGSLVNVFDGGLVVPDDWPDAVRKAVRLHLPESMTEFHM